MYNIILAFVLISALSGIVLILNRKRKVVDTTPDILEEGTNDLNSRLKILNISLPGWIPELKITKEATTNIAEKGLRRLRIFILRVDNRLTDFLGKLKEERVAPLSGNDRIQALITASAVQEIDSSRESDDQLIDIVWLKERDYLKKLNTNFDTDTFSQLTDFYLEVGDYSTLRELFLKAINKDLSWEDIIKDSRLINSLQTLKESSSDTSLQMDTTKKKLSPKVHQRKKKI